MEDQIAIQQVLNRYTIAACRADWDAVMATFDDGAIWEAPSHGIRSEGRAAIRSSLSAIVDQMDYFIQINTPAVIVVTGDTATATCAIHEYGRLTASGEAAEVFGLYDDSLVRTAAGWRFERRVFTLAGMNGAVPPTVPSPAAKG